MKIAEINLKIIPDSRGQDTLEAVMKSGSFSVISSVPAGKSRGKHEVFVLEPSKALVKFNKIKKEILEREFNNQKEFDNFLISLDGAKNKKNLGGNLILVLSLAFSRLMAKSENLELFQYIRSIAQLPITNYLPKPIFNVINGGAHAKNKLDFQEFQIIPEVNDYKIALGLGQEFYRKLKEFLENKFGNGNVSLGDEAGFSAPFKNNEEAIEILAEVIAKYNYPLRIGLDAAASQFYLKSQISNLKSKGAYIIDDKKYSAEQLKDLYLKLIDAYDILSIEDPFNEEDFGSFASLVTQINADSKQINADKQILIIADDLTTTNLNRLKIAVNKKSGNTILIKPNQIGTLTETLKVVDFAYQNNWQAIVSHRSGETMDDFIADLAVGVDAWGIKSGAPASPERMVKYNRLLEINKC